MAPPTPYDVGTAPRRGPRTLPGPGLDTASSLMREASAVNVPVATLTDRILSQISPVVQRVFTRIGQTRVGQGAAGVVRDVKNESALAPVFNGAHRLGEVVKTLTTRFQATLPVTTKFSAGLAKAPEALQKAVGRRVGSDGDSLARLLARLRGPTGAESGPGQKFASNISTGFLFGGLQGAGRATMTPLLEGLASTVAKSNTAALAIGSVGLAFTATSGIINKTVNTLDGLKDRVLGLAAVANPAVVSVFNNAVGLLTAKIGQYAVPVVAVAAATVMTLADVIESLLGDSLTSWADLLTDKVIPAVVQTIQALLNLTASVLENATKIAEAANKGTKTGVKALAHGALGALGSMTPLGGMVDDKVDSAMGKGPLSGLVDFMADNQSSMDKMAARLKSVAGDVPGMFSKNFNKVSQSTNIRTNQQAGVTPSFTGLNDVWKTLQLRTMQDPMQQAQLKAAQTGVDTLNRMDGRLANLERRPGGLAP
jgi:hypothetical protein